MEEKEQFGKLEQALQDLRDGKLILVIDDPERENEGDLICAAEYATPENVNAMASLAKGLICMPMSRKMCEKLGLNQMVEVNTDNHSTAFTVSIDHVETTTGISAFERSLTAVKTWKRGQNQKTSGDRDICFRWKPEKAVSSNGRDTRKRRWIL